MTTSDLNIVVKAKNEASKTLKTVQADVSAVNKASSLLKGGLASIAGAVSVGAFVEVTNQIGAMVEQANRVELLRQSFEQLSRSAGQSADSMLEAMRAASYGMVADADLMLSANKAMMLGVADNADEMTALLEVARSRGQAMGLDLTQAFNDIVTGLGRESALILDNLGITIDLEKVMQDYAKTLGTTADKLDGVQRKQALVNEVMRQSANMPTGAPSGAAAALAQAQVAQQQAAQEVGAFFAPNWRDNAQAQIDILNQLKGKYSEYAVTVREVSDVVTDQQFGLLTPLDNTQVARFTALRDALTLVGNAVAAGVPEAEQYATALEGIAQAALNSQNVTQQQANTIKLAADGTRAAVAEYEALRGTLDVLDPKLDNLRTSIAEAGAAASTAGQSVEFIKRKLAELAGQADLTSGALKSAWISAAGALGASQALAGFKASQKELDALTQAWHYMGLTSEEIEFRKAELVQGTNDGISAQISAIEDATTATKSYGGAVSGVSSAYSDLESKIAGVLSGTLDTGVGFSAEDILPREDAINENARRLADIAKNGLMGQDWLGEFAQEAPQEFAAIMRAVAEGGDAKQAAALILRDFEDGLRTSLIDKEAAKERVKRMILGEQSMAALASEIAAELAAEMGIPLQEAMAAAGAALGVPTGAEGEAATGTSALANVTAPDLTTQGAGAGDSFVLGFQSKASGTFLVASMVQQMESAIISFNTPGQNAGKTWGSGFMATVETSIAQPLINLLVTLVTPGVIAQLGVQNSQTTPP